MQTSLPSQNPRRPTLTGSRLVHDYHYIRIGSDPRLKAVLIRLWVGKTYRAMVMTPGYHYETAQTSEWPRRKNHGNTLHLLFAWACCWFIWVQPMNLYDA